MKQLYSILCILFVCSCSPKPDESKEESAPVQKIVDLSHDYSKETVYWVTAKEFELDTVFEGQTEKGYYYSAYNIATAEHGGTHIDAPIHFAAGKQTVDQIPLERLVGHAIKIDVSDKAMDNPDYLISVQDFLDWEVEQKLEVPDGSIVLLQTGFSTYYPDKVRYMGTALRGNAAIKLMHFPGLSPEAAEWLVNNRNISAIGLDTPSIDYGQSQFFKSHVILLSHNIPAFENLTNLDQLPKTGFEVVALPMKIKGGSGAPLRIIALVTE
ncbi:cyclase family protein [Flagellimonas sp.]|uniref:cyclase family protein n=1 Tax=Flagellimonas sp. TaxID=2058762 RepID=UPI003F4A57DD